MNHNCKFSYRFRVRFAESDPHNHVFNGAYYTYFDSAITEYFRNLNLLDVLNMYSDKLLYVLKTSARYYGEVFFDEEIDVFVKASYIGTSSIHFKLYVYVVGKNELKCEGNVIWVCTNRYNGSKAHIDSKIISKIQDFEKSFINPLSLTTERVIRKRKSIRKYSNEMVNREVIAKIIDTAKFAPSPKNRQAWKVIILDGFEKNKFIEFGFNCLQQLKDNKKKFGSLEISLNAMKEASCVLVIYNPYDQEYDYMSTWEKSDMQSIGAFINNILLMATEYNLGSLWINDVFFIQDKVKKWLSIDHDICALVALGVAGENPYQRPRKDLCEILIDVNHIGL